MERIRGLSRSFLWVAGLWVLGFCVFGRSLPYGFVYDDHWTLSQNPALGALLPAHRFFLDAETVSTAQGMGATIYRPVPTLSFALDNRIWGLKPWVLRLENLGLHLAAGVLLWLFLKHRMGLSPAAAAFGAAVFLFHPAQVESVVWVTQRSNLLCLLGILSALWFFTDEKGPFLARLGAGAASLSLALLSKETAVVFPALLGSWDLLVRRPAEDKRKRQRFWVYGVIVLITLAYLVLRLHVLGQLAQREFRAGGFGGNLLLGFLSWWEYGKIILFPFRLRVSRWQYVDDPWESPWPWLGLLFFLVYAVGVFEGARRRWMPRPVGFFLAWITLCLLPVLGWIPTDTFVAERFLYMPLVGWAGFLAVLWDRGEARDAMKKRVRKGLLLWGGILAFFSVIQTGVWKDDLSLWQAAAQKEPGNPFSRACLAEAYRAQQQNNDAEREYRACLVRLPTAQIAFAAMNNLAELYNRTGRPQLALVWSEKALAVDSKARAAHYNKIVSLLLLGRKQEALLSLQAAEAADPHGAWAELREKIRERAHAR
jgi:hypothetical protein